MSSLTAQDIGVKIRRRLGAPVSDRLRYHPLIDDALYRLVARKVAPAKRLRPLLLTDPAAATVTLVDGAADLSALVASDRILVACLRYGRITHASYSYALRLLESADQGALPNALDGMFPKCWLVGTTLHTSLDAEGNALTGDLALAVPYWPTLAQLPESLVESLVECACELLAENHADYEEGGGE